MTDSSLFVNRMPVFFEKSVAFSRAVWYNEGSKSKEHGYERNGDFLSILPGRG